MLPFVLPCCVTVLPFIPISTSVHDGCIRWKVSIMTLFLYACLEFFIVYLWRRCTQAALPGWSQTTHRYSHIIFCVYWNFHFHILFACGAALCLSSFGLWFGKHFHPLMQFWLYELFNLFHFGKPLFWWLLYENTYFWPFGLVLIIWWVFIKTAWIFCDLCLSWCYMFWWIGRSISSHALMLFIHKITSEVYRLDYHAFNRH